MDDRRVAKGIGLLPPPLPPGPITPSPRAAAARPARGYAPLPGLRLNQIVRLDRLGGLIHE